jgi:ADP-heptose:LPS heptosyltransferase
MSDRIRSMRRQLYDCRKRQPLTRFSAAALLVIVWPIKFTIDAILNAFKPTRPPKRIVVVQLAGLGDLLMLTPALAALKKNYPNAKIDFITLHDYVRDAFANHPYLNSIIALPSYPGQWIIAKFVNRSGWRLLLATLECYPTVLLKNLFVRYDLGINFGLADFDRNLGNALLYSLRSRRRIGSAGLADRLLTDRTNVNGERIQRAATYLNFLEPIGISPARDDAASSYEFPVQQNDVEAVKLALRTAGIDARRPLAVIQPGGKMHVNSRRWPAEYFVSVCEYLATSEGFEVVLIGDADDVDVCEQVARALGPKVKSLAGRLSFSESAALLSLSTLCITNDTSTLHLAEATKVPRVISIFGPTDADILAPQNSRNIVFKSKLPCAPCMGGIIDGNTELCWRDIKEECLWGITPDQVIDVLKQLYESAPARVASA